VTTAGEAARLRWWFFTVPIKILTMFRSNAHLRQRPTSINLGRLGFLLAFLVSSGSAPADDGTLGETSIEQEVGEMSYIDQDEPWKEASVKIPPLPEDDDLLEVDVDRLNRAFTLYLDSRHLAVGKDGITRYWMVIRSSRGASNVTYEGLSCVNEAYKVYAYASGGRKAGFRRVQEAEWKRIDPNIDPHFDLMDYLCDYVTARRPEDVVQMLRYNMPTGEDDDMVIGPYQQ
jgi:hypothetical protein